VYLFLFHTFCYGICLIFILLLFTHLLHFLKFNKNHTCLFHKFISSFLLPTISHTFLLIFLFTCSLIHYIVIILHSKEMSVNYTEETGMKEPQKSIFSRVVCLVDSLDFDIINQLLCNHAANNADTNCKGYVVQNKM
jgi:hypothetical protein